VDRGWRVMGRDVTVAHKHKTKIGYNYVHTAIDDHTRLAYSEIPRRRTRRHQYRVPAPSAGLIRQPRHHRRTRPDRQRDDLSPRPPLDRNLRHLGSLISNISGHDS
jgi:hypothetical protein